MWTGCWGTSLCFTLPSSVWKAGVLPRNPASGPEGARRRRLRARRKPAPLLLEARPGLPALLAAPGRAQDRQALLLQSPPAEHSRGRAGRRAACSYVLLRNSFSGKWGSFTQQRPLALSSVRRLQRPPTNVTVRHQDALAHLRALPRQAPRQAIYADPPYIFPGRSMNYYGTRRRGHSTRSSKTRSSQAACINDVPEAWELYSRAGSITRLCWQERLQARAAGSASGQSCVAQEWLKQSCARSCIPAPGPHQARARPAPGPHQWSEVGLTSVEKSSALEPASLRPKPRSRPRFSKPFAHFSAPKRAVTKRCGETVLGPRFGTVTRAYGDMA